MIVKFLEPSATFRGVFYSMDKVGIGKAELMAAVNFGLLDGLDEIRPIDYSNHLTAVSALNKRVKKPQLHVALSTTGETHDKYQLTEIAEQWLEKMGYGGQPYLIFYHQDTAHNHIHIVSTRINHDGRKISSAFEWIRALKAVSQIMGTDKEQSVQTDMDKANSYRFSTIAQFKLILEKQGYTIKDNLLLRFGEKAAELDLDKLTLQETDRHRATQLKAIFNRYAPSHSTAAFAEFLKIKMGIELVFHAKDGKPAYGYTIIDHAQKNVFKGGEVMPLKELLNANEQHEQRIITRFTSPSTVASSIAIAPDIQLPIHIASDSDDERVHGRRRRKKQHGRQQ